MLDIHSDIVYELMFYEILEHVGILTIGIELDLEAKITNLLTESWKITMDSRFTSTDRYSVQQSYASREKVKEFFLSMNISFESHYLLWKDKVRIMTKITTHIAPKGEYDTCQATWKIHE